MKPQYNPKLSTTNNFKLAYEQGKKDMLDEVLKEIEKIIIKTKKQLKTDIDNLNFDICQGYKLGLEDLKQKLEELKC